MARTKLKAAQFLYGLIRHRQGGASGDASWTTVGTTNTDVSAKDVFMQVGSVVSTAPGDFSVTFPVAFSQVPIVVSQVASASAYNGSAHTVSITTTGFTGRFMDTSWTIRAGETIQWIAIGQ